MVRFIRLLLNEKMPFFMVRTPDNWEAESRKIPEYQGKTAQKLAQEGLKAARRAPQFSKRWSRLQNAKNPGNATVSGAFLFWFCCFLLRKFDTLYPIFNGLTIGENLPPFRALRGASIETIFPPGIFVLLWYYFQIALHHWRRYGRIRYRGGTDA